MLNFQYDVFYSLFVKARDIMLNFSFLEFNLSILFRVDETPMKHYDFSSNVCYFRKGDTDA
jgi:hypothetical protein